MSPIARTVRLPLSRPSFSNGWAREYIASIARPNGRNINLNCGSLHLEVLQAAMLEQKADVGVAFDGDADRALFVARSGKIVDGDAVLFLTGRYLKEHGQLTVDGHPPLVVATVMSNLGLERALCAHGIAMIRTPVGDKYVLEEMLRRGAVLGGEQSGHIIFHRYATTGDGMLTALRVFEVMREAGVGLDELTQEIQVYPQRLVNVRIKERKRLEDLPCRGGRDPRGRRFFRRFGPRAGAVFRNRAAGASDGGRAGIGSRGSLRQPDCIADSRRAGRR